MGGWDILERLGLKEKAAVLDPRLETFWQQAVAADYTVKLEAMSATAPVLETDGAERVQLTCQCAQLFLRKAEPSAGSAEGYWAHRLTQALFQRLAKKSLPYAEQDLIAILACCVTWYSSPNKVVLGIIEQRFEGQPLPDALRMACRKYENSLERQGGGADLAKLRARVQRLLASGTQRAGLQLTRADAWSDALADLLEELAPAERDRLMAVLVLAESASGSKPSGKWLARSRAAIEAVGIASFNAQLLGILEHVGIDGGIPVLVPDWQGQWVAGDPTQVSQRHSDLLKGLIWAAGPTADAAVVQAIGDAAERCFKKLPNIGPRAPKVGNACLQALALAQAPNAVGQLSRLQTRVKHNSSRKQVERALNQVAEESGVSRDALQDMSVPSCGLTGIGKLEQPIGDYVAGVVLENSRDFELSWCKADGKPQKSIPASLKTEHATELKQLKGQLKELEQQLPVQCRRLESLLLSQRALPLADFQQHFAQHPLLGFLSRKLLWRVEQTGQVAGFAGDRLVDLQDHELSLDANTRLTLWHPLQAASAEEVQAWRRWLEQRSITQPFKQAHREIYLLTDAERQTATYSNRFAAHILKQHQFSALCRERGWHYTLQGGWDSHNTPYVDLPAHQLRVEYWVESAHQDGAETSDAGIFLYVVTDQVRFLRPAEPEPLELERVPPLVFSELMRDVDLFVGVSSVGNDPNWQDQGATQQFGAYWQRFAFGDLGETAKTRREALARLLPRLKVAQVCTLEERFLVVRGRLRTYRIHLGSANIQMEPGNQYLCIVPGRGKSSAPANIMLPFEGDATLSVILSKAIMLADDHKITDPSIQNQIGPDHYRN